MDRLELAPGVWVDARHAAWLAPERTLIVADLHLGYAWTQRQRGALLPLAEVEETASRLLALQAEYRPAILVLLGDLVHGQPLAEPVEASVHDLVARLAGGSQLVLTLGNHDAALPGFVARTGLPLRCKSAWSCGPHVLVHGDRMEARPAGFAEPPGVGPRDGFLIMGHEHPTVVLGDGVTAGARCPCFVVGANRLMLPAFSRWAAGVVIGREPFMSEVAREGRWHTAVAIVGERLLRVPWRQGFPVRTPG